jgi:hypothetical protein
MTSPSIRIGISFADSYYRQLDTNDLQELMLEVSYDLAQSVPLDMP